MLGRLLALGLLAAGVLAESGNASIRIVVAPFSRPALRIDATGNAEVSWSAKGERRAIVVPPRGKFYYGRLSGPDASTAVRGAVLPYRGTIRRTPDGRYWALQVWQTAFRGDEIELRFSRWTGAPTKITLGFEVQGGYHVLVGKATFHGRPISGTYRTNGGEIDSLAAALDCFACPAARGPHWFRFNGVKTRPDGTFGSGIQPAWMGSRFRASITGPNVDWTLAPDAAATVAAK